jgi:hypothetical protein
MEAYGQNLRYELWIDGGFLFFSAAGLDQAQADEPSKPLLTIADGYEGFRTVCKLIAALERSGVTEICLPLRLGEPGHPDCWVIA